MLTGFTRPDCSKVRYNICIHYRVPLPSLWAIVEMKAADYLVDISLQVKSSELRENPLEFVRGVSRKVLA